MPSTGRLAASIKVRSTACLRTSRHLQGMLRSALSTLPWIVTPLPFGSGSVIDEHCLAFTCLVRCEAVAISFAYLQGFAPAPRHVVTDMADHGREIPARRGRCCMCIKGTGMPLSLFSHFVTTRPGVGEGRGKQEQGDRPSQAGCRRIAAIREVFVSVLRTSRTGHL
jgi:hypothetical protein